MEFATGAVYDGDWENNMMHGSGFLILPNKETYEGSFVQNRVAFFFFFFFFSSSLLSFQRHACFFLHFDREKERENGNRLRDQYTKGNGKQEERKEKVF